VDANVLAPAALIFSVPLTLALFGAFPPYRAAFLTLLISALLLPVGYSWKVPLLQSLDKGNLPVLTAATACILFAPGRLRHLRLGGPILLPIGAIVLGPIFTAFNNGDPYLALPGMSVYDGFVFSVQNTVVFVIPFLLGRMLVTEAKQLEAVLRMLVVAFLLYSIPMLWEIRMSPQLHAMVYGYFPHQFFQQMRDGGYRPVVFIGHGLPLAILTSYALVACAMLWRRGRRLLGLPAMWACAYLAGMLVLCKTLSAGLYAGIGVPLGRFCSPKTQLRVAAVVSCLVLGYPLLRALDLFPIETLTQISESASEERSQSLTFRLDNEENLLERVRERPLLGWGGYGRNRVFDEEGRDISVTDGLWIILLGELGAVGFIGVFGLGVVPIFEASRALKNVPSYSDRCLLASCAFLIALNWVDSLPNALSGGNTMIFLGGAFSGVVEAYRVRRPVRQRGCSMPTPTTPLEPVES
jgi:hypothetical protein